MSNINLFDDLAAQFGTTLVDIVSTSIDTSALSAATPPTLNDSFDGDTDINLLSGDGILAIGDELVVTLVVTIDPDASGSSTQLRNQATATGADPDGNQFSDLSDDPDNLASNSDPTPIYIADLGVAKSVVGVPVEQAAGIFVVTYQVVVENPGTVDLTNLSLIEDVAENFGAPFINASNLVLASGPSDPGSSISLNSGFNGGSNTELIDATATNLLQTGDSFVLEFDVEFDATLVMGVLSNQIEGSADAVDEDGDSVFLASGAQAEAFGLGNAEFDPGSGNLNNQSETDGATGNPPTFTGLAPISARRLSNFLNTPSPIFSGTAADPLSLQSNRPVTGGYSVDAGTGDCGCPEPINPCCQPVDSEPVCEEPVHVEDPCGCETGSVPVSSADSIPDEILAGEAIPADVILDSANVEAEDSTESDEQTLEESDSIEAVNSVDIRIDRAENKRMPSFLKRFSNWMLG